MWQDIDPNAPFYRKTASASAIAPYVMGVLPSPAIPVFEPVQVRPVARGNGALPANAYDVAA
jgi:hypothetical protein